jgi:hypothetical protein
MPTVQMAQLHQEAAQLSTHFANPTEYLRALEILLETYSMPVHRQGRVRGLRPVLFSYQVPAPVLKQLHLEMALKASQQPGEALALADALWAARTIETRLLAARLLGVIPASDPVEISSRLETWAEENREEILAPELCAHGALYICAQFSDQVIPYAAHLLACKEIRKQILGLGILQTLLGNNHYGNLPLLFNQLNEISNDPAKKLRPYLADLLTSLAQHSPKEAVYFLQQRLAESPSEGTNWVARQVLKSLPEGEREQLRQALKG